MPTIVGILTFMSGKNSILGLSEPKKAEFLGIFLYLWAFKIPCSTVEHGKSFITSGPRTVSSRYLQHWYLKAPMYRILDFDTFPSFTNITAPVPEVIKLFMLSSIEHEIFLLINLKMPTNVGFLTFIGGKNSILGLSEPTKRHISLIFLYL